MSSTYHAIYLAPHLDDAALSCGGQIAQQCRAGKKVLIVTVMAGDPPRGHVSPLATSMHERWALQQDVVAARRAEDIRATEILGAAYLHWDFLDCIYRGPAGSDRPFYQTNDEIFGAIHPDDRPLVDKVAKQLATLPRADRLVAPLTVGNHVDHQIVRRAAEQLFGDRLLYYEDYPYARDDEAVERVTGTVAYDATVLPLTDADIERRIAAIAAYRSQISTWFADTTDLAVQVRAIVAKIGGERLWANQRL